MQDEITGLQHTIRSQAGTIGNLKRDPEAAAKKDADWSRCEDLFKDWRRITGHPNSRFTVDRFRKAKPMLNAYEDALHIRAYHGAAYDPYRKPRKNGTEQVFNGWNTIYKNADTFEEYANRSPFNSETLEADLAEVEARR